jgi:hypothetical protein
MAPFCISKNILMLPRTCVRTLAFSPSRFIKKDEDNCKGSVKASGPKISCEVHSDFLHEKMGRAIFVRLGEEAQRVDVSTLT